MRLNLLVLSLMLLVMIPTSAQESITSFQQANKAYQENRFDDAILSYTKIISSGYESWEVYYNLGNAYYKKDEIAHAILNLERALILDPQNDDIKYNLQLARLRIVDKIQEIPRLFFINWLRQISYAINIEMSGIATLLLLATFIATLIVRLLKNKPLFELKLTSFFLLLLLFLFSSSLLYRIYDAETNIHAIILTERVDIKSAPDDNSTDVFTLHSGVKVEIKDRSVEWVKIRLLDGKVGWTKKSDLEVI